MRTGQLHTMGVQASHKFQRPPGVSTRTLKRYLQSQIVMIIRFQKPKKATSDRRRSDRRGWWRQRDLGRQHILSILRIPSTMIVTNTPDPKHDILLSHTIYGFTHVLVVASYLASLRCSHNHEHELPPNHLNTMFYSVSEVLK